MATVAAAGGKSLPLKPSFIDSIEESRMLPIAKLSSIPSALSAVTGRSHSHKKGSRVDSSSESQGDAMTPVPAGTQQNLFSSMLQSLEQVIGVQPGSSTAASAPAAAAGTPASTAAAAHKAPASAVATASSNAALQKYLHNVSSPTNDIRFPTVTGSNLSASA
jgi:hypothetical protein